MVTDFPDKGWRLKLPGGSGGMLPWKMFWILAPTIFQISTWKNIFWLINQSTRVMSLSTIRVLNSWTRAEYKETDGTGLNLEHLINLCIYYEVSDQSVCKMAVTGVDPHLLIFILILLLIIIIIIISPYEMVSHTTVYDLFYQAKQTTIANWLTWDQAKLFYQLLHLLFNFSHTISYSGIIRNKNNWS